MHCRVSVTRQSLVVVVLFCFVLERKVQFRCSAGIKSRTGPAVRGSADADRHMLAAEKGTQTETWQYHLMARGDDTFGTCTSFVAHNRAVRSSSPSLNAVPSFPAHRATSLSRTHAGPPFLSQFFIPVPDVLCKFTNALHMSKRVTVVTFYIF